MYRKSEIHLFLGHFLTRTSFHTCRRHARARSGSKARNGHGGLAEILLAKWKATRKSRLVRAPSTSASVRPSVTVERTERATTLAQQEEDTTTAAAALTGLAVPDVPACALQPPSLPRP